MFEFEPALGEEHNLQAHEHPTLVPVFEIYGAHVTEARVTETAEFKLSLDSGARLKAGSLDAADHWEFQQPWPREPQWR